MKQKPSKKGQVQPVPMAADAETLYQRYLNLRAERDTARNEAEHPGTALKKVNRGDILS
jgi:hypothetical protein